MVQSMSTVESTVSKSNWSCMNGGGSSIYFGWGNSDWCSWMGSMSRPGYDSIKAIVGISGVVNSTDGAVWFNKRVLSLDGISVTDFRLRFVVTSMGIGYSIFEFVLGWCLKIVFK